MDAQKIRDYWHEEAKEALTVAEHLFEKEDYSYSLFFGHLAIEKMLKAIFAVKNGTQAPYLHNLLRLAELANVTVSEEMKRELIAISTFALESRYPDMHRSFRKTCTHQFAREALNTIIRIFRWLESMLM